MSGVFRIAGIGDAAVGVTTRYGSKPHFHDGYSIGIFHGPARISFRGAVHAVDDGELIVLEPGEAHGGRGESGDCPQDGLVIDPEYILMMFGSRRPATFPVPVIRDRPLVRLFVSSLRQQSTIGLTQAITELFLRHGCTTGTSEEAAPSLAVPLDGSIRLQAAASRLSRSHYSRKVRAEIGLSPRDYRRQKRVHAARDLIEQGCALADTAAQTGFADQAHMTRQMRTILGVTPGAIRRR